MQIDNVNIYNLAEAIAASGLSMMALYDRKDFGKKRQAIQAEALDPCDIQQPDIKRAIRLAANPAGTGHNNFLSGILVTANVTTTNAFWIQCERYNFLQIVSSQRKMHCLRAMIDSKNAFFNDKTSCSIVHDFLDEMKDSKSEGINEEKLVYSCPLGLELTAHISTNYLQLKTIYFQRRNHKLLEWRDFCEWIEGLLLSFLITNQTPEKNIDQIADDFISDWGE